MFTPINSFRWLTYTLAMLSWAVLMSACAVTPTQPATGVTFVAPVPVEAFSSKTALQVGVWNARQLEQLDRQAECVVAADAQTQAETVLCPEGVQYEEITPEEFVFPIRAIQQSIQFTSQTVKAGENYQIVLRGLSRDDCNSMSATAEGTATASIVTLGKLEWATTEMACVTTP